MVVVIMFSSSVVLNYLGISKDLSCFTTQCGVLDDKQERGAVFRVGWNTYVL